MEVEVEAEAEGGGEDRSIRDEVVGLEGEDAGKEVRRYGVEPRVLSSNAAPEKAEAEAEAVGGLGEAEALRGGE